MSICLPQLPKLVYAPASLYSESMRRFAFIACAILQASQAQSAETEPRPSYRKEILKLPKRVPDAEEIADILNALDYSRGFSDDDFGIEVEEPSEVESERYLVIESGFWTTRMLYREAFKVRGII